MVPVLAALVLEILRSLRRGEVGLDIVAALSMGAALAFGEPLAGNADAQTFIAEAYKHYKPIGAQGEGQKLVDNAPCPDLKKDAALGVLIDDMDGFVQALGQHRYWNRVTGKAKA